MINEEMLQNFNNIQDSIFDTIEDIKFNDKDIEPYSIFRVKELVELIDVFEKIEDHIDDYENIFPIIVGEDKVIYPESLSQIKTNVTDYSFDDSYDVFLEGFVPKLSFFKDFDENNKIIIKVQSKFMEKYNQDSKKKFNDPYILDKDISGIYKLKKGSIIGFVTKRKKLEKETSFVKILK